MRLFSFPWHSVSAPSRRLELAGKVHIVRCLGIEAGFFPRCCGVEDGIRNAAALSEGTGFTLAGLALRMRWTTQDAATTIQFFRDALRMRHRGGRAKKDAHCAMPWN